MIYLTNEENKYDIPSFYLNSTILGHFLKKRSYVSA